MSTTTTGRTITTVKVTGLTAMNARYLADVDGWEVAKTTATYQGSKAAAQYSVQAKMNEVYENEGGRASGYCSLIAVRNKLSAAEHKNVIVTETEAPEPTPAEVEAGPASLQAFVEHVAEADADAWTVPAGIEEALALGACQLQVLDDIKESVQGEFETPEAWRAFIHEMALLSFKVTGPRQITATSTNPMQVELAQIVIQSVADELDLTGEYAVDGLATVFTWI